MLNKLMIFAALAAVCLLVGCAAVPPVDTSAGISSLQHRALTQRNIGYELGATYNDVWYATIATLQMNGFVLKQADKSSGFIYGVWQDAYEKQFETSNGAFGLTQLGTTSNTSVGIFSSKTEVFKQIDVSVTFEPIARTQTLVRIVSRFDSTGIPVAEGVFANRFFGILRKEIFLRKNGGSNFVKFTTTK